MLRILIADDHDIVRQGISQALLDEFPDADIHDAADTSSLLEKALNHAWDIIITDLAMPGGGGLFALEKIREVNAEQPVLVISTYDAEQYAVRVMKAGAWDFISKNDLPASLIAAVHRIVDVDK